MSKGFTVSYGGKSIWLPNFTGAIFDPLDLRSSLLCAAGVVVPAEAVTLNAQDRQVLGQLYKRCPWFVVDDLSVHWMLHYGITAKKAPHPAFLFRHKLDLTDWVAKRFGVSREADHIKAVEPAAVPWFMAAGYNFVALVPHDEGKSLKLNEDPMYRMCAELGCLDQLVYRNTDVYECRMRANTWSDEDVAPYVEVATRFYDGLVDRAVHQDRLKVLDGPRELKLGTVFDPATHYTKHYFDGRGLLYTKSDGTKEVYHGPSASWGGYYGVTEVLDRIFDSVEGEVVDLGCGPGEFVRVARERGWDAYGIDISDEAIKLGDAAVKPYLSVQDITKGELTYNPTLVTAWDLWEHIWEQDVDALIRGVRDALVPGGYHVACICTRGDQERDWVFNPGVQFTQENSVILCSGHVNIRNCLYWVNKFRAQGFTIRLDLMHFLNVMFAEHVDLQNARSWSPRNMLIVQKV
jgi:SAM-dependent methyltransferase